MKVCIVKIINKISTKLLKIVLPYNFYAKYIGVRFGENCLFLTKKFGSEPYMISFGNNCEVSYNVDFITHDGSIWVIRNLYNEYKNMDILKPINIGDNVIVAAGSVVSKNIPSNSVVAGVPAKVISTIDEYLEKNKKFFSKTKQLSDFDKKQFFLENIMQKD